MNEEGFEFKTKEGVFYNPKMTFCRSISSLAVGSISQELSIVDGFCASGIRGLRYAHENPNVSELSFVDCDEKAIKLVKSNSKKIKCKKSFKLNNFSKLAFDLSANFIELDPFGTPSPFIFDALRMVSHQKRAYISATATDVAVLCGSNKDACAKNYHSKPLNNEFTHENGLRILINRIATLASEFNFGITPLISFSDQHYLKTIIQIDRSAVLAVDSLTKSGYVTYCPSCLYREEGDIYSTSCSFCKNSKVDYCGPLWRGPTSSCDFVSKMITLNKKRQYSNFEKIDEFLNLIKNEQGFQSFHYGVHEICKKLKLKNVPKFASVLESLNSNLNSKSTAVHFGSNKFKTTLDFNSILGVFRKF